MAASRREHHRADQRHQRSRSFESSSLLSEYRADAAGPRPDVQSAVGDGRLKATSSEVGPEPVATTMYCLPPCK